ncbi:hypothetical protein Hanom_Chr15g01364131 [Helianthus anomalus]
MVYGVPLCLIDNKIIDDVGSLFGKVVKGARVDRVGLDNSFQFLGVLVNHGLRMQEFAFLRWKGKTYKVWISEDPTDWLEDFVAEDLFDDSPRVDERKKSSEDRQSEFQPEVPPAAEEEEQERDMETVGEVNANDCVTNCGPKLTPSVMESFETGGINEQVLNERDPSKDLKRKKNKKQGDVGLLGSGGYPSSNERPNKEPKLVVDDPFELEPVILGLDTNVMKTM